MKIVIIGAQAAGASAAAKARRIAPDAEIIVYESSSVVSFGACGLPYFIAGCFDSPDTLSARTVAQFAKSNITIKTRHVAEKLDAVNKCITVRDLELDKTAVVSYDKLLLACGASAILPPIKNRDLPNVTVIKDLNDGVFVREKMADPAVNNVVIVGAGFIGLEVADAVHVQGKQVRVIQLDNRVLQEFFDAEITTLFESELKNNDIAVHTDEIVRELRGNQRVTAVVTDKGEYAADLVVIAAGARPNTKWLTASGVEMLANGAIVIDDQCRTNLPDVYAAGDCASVYHRIKQRAVYIPLATTANKLGKICGENLCGKAQQFPGTLGSAGIKVLNLEAGRTGLTENEAIQAGIPHKAVLIRDKNHSNFWPNQTDIFVKLIYHAQTRVLLGGQIAGVSGAALRVDTLSAAIWNEMTVDELGSLDLLYAPPFSRPWDALNIAANAAK